MLYLGIDTSNYTTSVALYDAETGEMSQRKRLLPVRMAIDDKDRIMDILNRCAPGAPRIAAWRCLDLPDAVMGLLEELETLA